MNPSRYDIVTTADAWAHFGSITTPEFMEVEAALGHFANALARSAAPHNELSGVAQVRAGSLVALCEVDAEKRTITVRGLQRAAPIPSPTKDA